MNDDDLDVRLRAADRMAGVRLPASVLARLEAEVRATATRRARRRVSAAAGLGIFTLGALVAVPGVAAAVQQWLAVAEWQPEAGGEILPDSEMIDLSAPDLPEYIASRFPDSLPIPPEMSKQAMIDEVVGNWQQVDAFTQEVAFRENFERLAYCGWVDAWLTSSDPGVVEDATRAIEDAVNWPAFNETDGGGVIAFLTIYAAAARTGDHDGIQFAAWQYGCSAWDGDPRQWWVALNGPTW